MTHAQWNLLAKTELRIEDIGLDGADLTALAGAVADVLDLHAAEVYVIDARDRLLTFDVLRETIDPYKLVGRSDALLEALGRLPGVTVDDSTTMSSEGMLGWITEDYESGRQALDRSRQMADEIERSIASRAIVFSTGNEVIAGQIQDTNKPWISNRLRIARFRVVEGDDLPDDSDVIAATIREAVEERGFGLVVTTGGVGAETKDGTVESLLRLCPEASTPYLFRVEQGHGRHAKPGVRIGVGVVAGSTVVCLPGPHAEAMVGTEALLEGLGQGLSTADLAEHIAVALRLRLRQSGMHWQHDHQNTGAEPRHDRATPGGRS